MTATTKTFSGVKGMPDVLPQEAKGMSALLAVLQKRLESVGFKPIWLPILESTDVFERGVGTHTDIAQKEMYTLMDRNGESLALRPEGTASLMRSAIEHHLVKQSPARLWYQGPMFRYERPQKGRQRQFYQVSAEHIGPSHSLLSIIELILMTAGFWSDLGLKNLQLQINSLGGPESRKAYQTRLVEYLNQHKDKLDPDSATRLENNPLRILDSKNPDTQALLNQAPSLEDSLSSTEKAFLKDLGEALSLAHVPYTINPRLVRGLDYYDNIVFEWVSEDLGAQSTLCAGGQYNYLANDLGSPYPIQAAGFALGLERLYLVAKAQQAFALKPTSCQDIYVVIQDESLMPKALALTHVLNGLGFRTGSTAQIKSLKAQMKDADQSGAQAALVIAPEEDLKQGVQLKPLRGQGQSQFVSYQELDAELSKLIPAQT